MPHNLWNSTLARLNININFGLITVFPSKIISYNTESIFLRECNSIGRVTYIKCNLKKTLLRTNVILFTSTYNIKCSIVVFKFLLEYLYFGLNSLVHLSTYILACEDHLGPNTRQIYFVSFLFSFFLLEHLHFSPRVVHHLPFRNGFLVLTRIDWPSEFLRIL